MKKNKRNQRFLTSLFIMLFACTAGVFAQSIISGTVKDGNGEPLLGVTVAEPGNNNGVITDVSGKYSINVKSNAVLVFSYIGMATQEVKVAGKHVINVMMKDDVAALDEIVVVGYGTQKRASITGAVSTVSNKEILKAPTMSISNIIGSRVAGISAVQSSGQPGSDNASLTVRGQSDIIYVIDGIRRTAGDFNGLDPNEIESVSVLKDASAVAVYGLNANGAFIVTTKKGKTEKMSISYTGKYGVSNNAEQQEWLDGPKYAYWYNKALNLDGKEALFTKDMVQKMRDGVDGWGNTNWYDKVFGTGTRQHHNVSASGGTEKIRFFTSIGYLKEQGNIDNFNYDRLNLRSNIDAKLTRTLTITLGVSGRVETRNQPRYSADPNAWLNLPLQAIRALPYAADTYEFEGNTYQVATPQATGHVAPVASVYDSGYNKSHSSFFQSNFSLKYDAPWLKGLSFKFQGAYDLTYTFGKVLTNPYEVMIMDLPTAESTQLKYHSGVDPAGNNTILSESGARGYTFTTQSSINYDNVFGKHTINALLLAETREEKSNLLSAAGYGLDFIELDELNNVTNQSGDGSSKSPLVGGFSGQTRTAGFVGRVNYSYADKYYAEASLRYDGSYLFGGMNKRWITLPGLSLGWRINNENWFNLPWVNNLKLRAGIGKTGTSGELKPNQWSNSMGFGKNSAVIGGSSQSALYYAILGNSSLTWAQCMNYNIGFDATLWNGLLGVEFDVFYKYEYDKLGGISGLYPQSMGGYYFEQANVNKADYKGFDLTLNHHNRIGSFNYGAKLIWSYAYGRWLKFAGDAENTPDYQKVTGKQIGAKYGFISMGLFQNEEEIANSATMTGKTPLPGYISYMDRNGDGVITREQDLGYVGKSSRPTHNGSLSFFGDWKGFDFDMLFSWGLGHDIALTGQYTAEDAAEPGTMDHTSFTKPFYQKGNSPTYLVENSWRPDHTNVDFPRLEVEGPNNQNGYSSTFWYKKGNYLRLKTVQIGYSFPKQWMNPMGVERIRLFAEGYNLFTISGLTKYNIDPESPAVNNGYYPQQRTFTFGVNLTF